MAKRNHAAVTMKDGFNIGSRLLPSGVYESAGRATVSPYHAYRP